MVVRVPRFLVIPICLIAAGVWAGRGIVSFTTKPTVTVYAGDSDVNVEVLDAKQRVEARVSLSAGDRSTLTVSRGKHTVRSTKLDGTKHESALKLGFADKYAVPTSPDQCFALVDISAWYGKRYNHKIDVIDAKIERRLTKSEPYEFPDQTYGTLRETPSKVDYKDRPKLVTAVSCSKIERASDGEVLATLERRLTIGSTTLTSLTMPKPGKAAEKPIPASGATAFSRMMGEQKPDWMRVHEDEATLAYRNKGGEFLIVDARAIPSATADFVANIEKPETKGVYRKTDILPSLTTITTKPLDPQLEIGGLRAGLVLRRTDEKIDYAVSPAVLVDLATKSELEGIAVDNVKTRYAAATAKCLSKIAAKPAVCAADRTDASGILLLAKDAPNVKGKVWFRVDAKNLQIAKGAKKIPTTGFGDVDASPSFFTLEKNELTSALW